jgi:hypothetical protein
MQRQMTLKMFVSLFIFMIFIFTLCLLCIHLKTYIQNTTQSLPLYPPFTFSPPNPKGTTGRFLQVKGLKFTWNPTRTPMRQDANGNIIQEGDRVTKIRTDSGYVWM